MAKKRKAATGSTRRRAAPARARRRAQQQPVVREIPLGQGLQAFASEGISSLFWVIVAASAIVIAAAVAVGIWTLRPIPEYASEGIEAGSPFDVAFRIRNTSQWFALSRPSIDCILTWPGAPDVPPVRSSELRVGSASAHRLEPGESGTFRCPFPPALRDATNGETTTALRSQIYFRATYDLPLFESFRLSDSRGPFVLNTRLLPPRWTARP